MAAGAAAADEAALTTAGVPEDTLKKPGDTPLHVAARAGHVEAVKQLLASEGTAAVNAVNSEGETPLLMAASWGIMGHHGGCIMQQLPEHQLPAKAVVGQQV